MENRASGSCGLVPRSLVGDEEIICGKCTYTKYTAIRKSTIHRYIGMFCYTVLNSVLAQLEHVS